MLEKLNPRTLLLLTGILAILAVAGTVRRHKTAAGNFDATPTRTIDTAAVTSVVIWPQYVFVNRTNTLERTADGWTITRDGAVMPASQQAVREMLSALIGIRASRVVSHSEADWGRYGLDAETGTRINVYAGSQLLLDFRLGRLSMFNRDGSDPEITAKIGFDPQYIDTYMRIEGDPTVYMADGFFSHSFTRLWEEWIDTLRTVPEVLP